MRLNLTDCDPSEEGRNSTALQYYSTAARVTGLSLIAGALFFTSMIVLDARPDGRDIPTNGGVLGEMPCFASNCHGTSGGTFNDGGSVTFVNLPSSFVPGETYDLSVTMAGGTVYGLQVVTLYSDNTQAGTLTPLTPGVTIRMASGVDILLHAPFSLNTGTVNFQWTAPIDPKETSVIFKVASNSANGDSNNTGDKINTQQVTVPLAGPELTEKLYFAQFGDGGGLSSQITLMTLGFAQAVNGKIELFSDDGTPMTVDLNGELVTGEKDFAIPAGGAAIFSTDGAGDPQAGAVVVSSDQPLAGVILFSGLGVAGVGSSQPLQTFRAPVEMDSQNEIRAGVAVMDTDGLPKTLQVELIDLEANIVATGTVATEPLPANGHVARFLDEFDWGANPPDLSNFRGVLRVTASTGEIAATVLRLGTAGGEATLATLPVTEEQ